MFTVRIFKDNKVYRFNRKNEIAIDLLGANANAFNKCFVFESISVIHKFQCKQLPLKSLKLLIYGLEVNRLEAHYR